MLYCFGDYELDEQLYQLRRAGKLVEIEPRVFNVLAYLLHHQDRVVSKEELLDKLWPEQIVTEAALTRCIVAARKAVGDDGAKQNIIETQHGRGYRFIAPLTATSPVASSQQEVISSQYSVASREEGQTATGNDSLESSVPSLESENPNVVLASDQSLDARRRILADAAPTPFWSTKNLVLTGVLLLVGVMVAVQYLSMPTPNPQSLTPSPQSLPLPDKPSLVVLPFTNLSGDPEQDYFSDGMTEELITTLARLPSLFVIARHSAFTYKDKAVKIQDVGKELGVRYVLEGSVQRAEQRVRINARLVDTVTGDHLWVERYGRAFSDIFTLQDEIVQKIVTTLRLQLTLEEQGVIIRKRTDKVEAYDYLLRGSQYYSRFTKEGTLQARRMFEKAIELDPQYAEAYTSLGWTYCVEWGWRWSQDPQTLERALVLARQAIALDDSLPGAHEVLSWVYAQQQQYDQAIAEGERVITLDPNAADSYANLGEILNYAGRPEEGLRMLEQAMRINPRYPAWYLVDSGWAYRLTGRYEEAIATLKTSLQRNPDFLSAYLQLALSYVEQWGFQLSLDPQTLERAFEAAQRAVALSDSWSVTHLVLGVVYLLQQQYDHALAEMERAVALDSTLANGYAALALVLSHLGRPEDALEAAEQALRLKPDIVDTHLLGVGIAYARAGRPEAAIAPLQRFVGRYPNILGAHCELAAVHSELGREAEAREAAAEVLRLNPNFSLEVHKDRMPIKDPAVLERHIVALRKAGLR